MTGLDPDMSTVNKESLLTETNGCELDTTTNQDFLSMQQVAYQSNECGFSNLDYINYRPGIEFLQRADGDQR